MWLEHRKQRPGRPKEPTRVFVFVLRALGPIRCLKQRGSRSCLHLKRSSWSLGGVDTEGRLWWKVAAAGAQVRADESLDQVEGNGNREEEGFYGRQN